MLYACYDLIPMHRILELSWRNGLIDCTYSKIRII
jgi:hypothetical protein